MNYQMSVVKLCMDFCPSCGVLYLVAGPGAVARELTFHHTFWTINLPDVVEDQKHSSDLAIHPFDLLFFDSSP